MKVKMWPQTESIDDAVCNGCPLHCTHPNNKIQRPKTGLYGKIAELQAQMQHMQSMHLQERDSLLVRLQEEEDRNRKTTALNTHLSKSLRQHHKNVMTERDDCKRRQRTQYPLRRSKSHEALNRPSLQRISRFYKHEENDYEQDERLHTSLPQSYDTTSLNGSPTMAPIQEVDEESEWVREKERLTMLNEALSVKVRGLEEARARLEWELKDVKEQSELLEFRVLELEEANGGLPVAGCTMHYTEECTTSTAPLRLEAEERRLRSKELEFRLKFDAVKCERDETVALLEARLVEMQRRHEETLETERAQWQSHSERQRNSAKSERDELLSRIYRLEELIAHQEEAEAATVRQLKDEVYEGVGGSGCGSTDPEAREREAQLEQRVFELEQKQIAYRATIAEADRIMANVERTYQERVDELELSEQRLRARITQLEQSEKRLQRSLLNSTSTPTSAMSSSTSEAEKRNLRAEMAEREDRVRQLEERESALRETLAHADVILAEREKGFRDTIEKLQMQLMQMRETKEEEQQRPNTPSDIHMEQIAAELQNLSDKEDNVRSIGEKVHEIKERIKECENCEPFCGPLLLKLGSEVKQLDEIIFGCKSPTSDAGRSLNFLSVDGDEQPKAAVKNQEKSLEEKLAESEKQMSFLKCQLEVQDAEMRAMDQEASLLQVQLESRENETRHQHEDIVHLREQILQMKMQLRKSDLCHRSTAQRLDQRNEELTIARTRCSDMERRMSHFAARTRALENAQQEKDTLQERLAKAEAELTKKRENEHRLCAENLHLHHKVEGLRERINSLQLIKRDHKVLLTQHSNAEKKLAATEATIAPLQSQINRLRNDCKEKDRIINQLRNEKKNKRGANDGERKVYSSWVAPRVRPHHSTASSDDSGIHDLSPGSSGESEASDDSAISRNSRLILPRNYPCLTSTSSISSNGDSSLSGSMTMSDITEGDSDAITPPSNNSAANNGRGSKIPRYIPLRKHLSQDVLSALKESSSKASSQNSLVTISSESSQKTLTKSATLRRDRNSLTKCSSDSLNVVTSEKSSRTMFPKRTTLSHTRVMTNTVIANMSSMVISKKIYIAGATDHAGTRTDDFTETPVTFNITRKIGQDGLLVAWEMPSVESNGNKNTDDDVVSGYQIFVNGILQQKVRSAHRTKALLNNLNLNKPLDISIHAISVGGILSPPAFARFTPETSLPTYI